MRFDSGPEVFVRANRNYVLTEYVLNENDCSVQEDMTAPFRLHIIDVGLLRTGCVIRGVGQDAPQLPTFLSQMPRKDDLPNHLKAGPPLIWVFGHFWLFCTMV